MRWAVAGLAALEVTGGCGLRHRGLGLVADVVFAMLIYGSATLTAGPERLLGREVDLLATFLAFLAVSKVKFELWFLVSSSSLMTLRP